MARQPRIDLKDYVYHVINRANARATIFIDDLDYDLFESLLKESKEKYAVKIYSYCIMPNHFHLVLSPEEDGNVARFMHYLTMTFTQRWHRVHKTVGSGHLFQGRYKSFIVQDNIYLLQLLLYVERNPLRANLVNIAENWRWSSLWLRLNKSTPLLSQWPLIMPSDYLKVVNETSSTKILNEIRLSLVKGSPFGAGEWKDKIIETHKLQHTMRSAGRPKNSS